MHTTAPAVDVDPASHGVHCDSLDRPGAAPRVPAGHAEHCVDAVRPVRSEKVPSGQAAQLVGLSMPAMLL